MQGGEDENTFQSKKKKGKGGKQKKGESLTDVELLCSQMQEAIKEITEERKMSEKMEKWAQSLFDEAIIAALPLTNAKKKFNKMNFVQATEFFTKLRDQFVNL